MGEAYNYDSEAEDPDFDPIRYSLAEGPVGLVIDSTTGEVSLPAAGVASDAYKTVSLGDIANFSLGQLENRSSEFPAGSFTVGEIPFFIPETGRNVWHSEFAEGDNPRVAEIAVSTFGVTEVNLLINSYYGELTDGTLAAVEFIGENGSFFRKELDGNKDIRDYIENTFTNNINGTTTINAFTGVADLNNSSREIRLDLVQVELPDEFQNDTLSQIRLIDSGATGCLLYTSPSPRD